MGVRTTEAKGAHPHHRWGFGLGEGFQGGLHLQLEALEINRGIGGAEVEAGRQLAVVHAQRGLNQTGDASRRFRMAQVGFHRTHPARTGLVTAVAQNSAKRPQLDRITLAGAGAMGFHVLGGGGFDPGAGKGGTHAGDLGPQVGRHHAVATAV